MTGTILDYSSWLGIVGTNTALQSQVSSARLTWLSGGWYGLLAAVMTSIFSGVWLVLN